MADGDSANVFSAGPRLRAPEGDVARQAVASLRGYAYQVIVATLAWLDVADNEELFLEVAEDYATAAADALRAVQVKDTAGSGSVTLQSGSIQSAISAFVNLVHLNPDRHVQFQYLTTSPVGLEKETLDRPSGEAGLVYWRKAAAGADVSPLRKVLDRDGVAAEVRAFVSGREDQALREQLLQRIHWTCSQPDIGAVERELASRLVILLRDQFHAPSSEVGRVSDSLIYRVLTASIASTVQQRRLNRADLYSVIDNVTQVTVPRVQHEQLQTLLSASVASGSSSSIVGSLRQADWLVEENSIPLPRNVIARTEIVGSVSECVRKHGFLFLSGGTGMGKSTLARLCLRSFGDTPILADLRGYAAPELQLRLDTLLGILGARRSRLVLLDDIGHLEEPQIIRSLGRLIASLRRLDKIGIATTYNAPSADRLSEIGLAADAVVTVPYFSEDEVGQVVEAAKGDTKTWSKVTYISGGFGHPQLVQAFVAGMSARGWPRDALENVVTSGWTSTEINAARNSARRTLVASLNESTRTLLYRLSLVAGKFERATAIALGEVAPAILRPGEELDRLIGPWIEVVEEGRFRVSPLAALSGNEILPKDEQHRVHEKIAHRYIVNGRVRASDANALFGHAILGKSEPSLMMLAHAVVTASEQTIEWLSENFLALQFMRFDVPLYPDNPSVSCILRLAQFKLLAGKDDTAMLANCVDSLFDEIERLPKAASRRRMETAALAAILPRVRAAMLPNWMGLLVKFFGILHRDTQTRRRAERFQAAHLKGATLIGFLFMVGSYRGMSGPVLESICNELNRLTAEQRNSFLSGYERSSEGYALFVNSTWLAESRERAPKWEELLNSYRKLVTLARNWGNAELALRFTIAQSTILDEYLNAPDRAMEVLEIGRHQFGENVAIARAHAKILFRKKEHAEALPILEQVIREGSALPAIEKAFIFREAGISAATIGNWEKSQEWFLRGSETIGQAKSDEMNAMSIGLLMDASVSAFKAENRREALQLAAKSLERLPSLSSSSLLVAHYCHCAVRHAVNWLAASVRTPEKPAEGGVVNPGMCSNTSPLEAIRNHRIAHIDVAWYLLADTELLLDEEVGIVASLSKRMASASSDLELGLRANLFAQAIRRGDVDALVRHLPSLVAVLKYFQDMSPEERRDFDVYSPRRTEIRPLTGDELAVGVAGTLSTNALLSFCTVQVLAGHPARIDDAVSKLLNTFGSKFPGHALVEWWADDSVDGLDEMQRAIADYIRQMRASHVVPLEVWMIGARTLEFAKGSLFRRELTGALEVWLRSKVAHFVEHETFRLKYPSTTISPINDALISGINGERFIASILLASAAAVGAKLSENYRQGLTELAQ